MYCAAPSSSPFIHIDRGPRDGNPRADIEWSHRVRRRERRRCV